MLPKLCCEIFFFPILYSGYQRLQFDFELNQYKEDLNQYKMTDDINMIKK